MVSSRLLAGNQRGGIMDVEGLSGDAIEDPEVGLTVREPRAMLIVEASELLVLKGSSVVVAIDVIAVGIIVVAIAAIASAVNYSS